MKDLKMVCSMCTCEELEKVNLKTGAPQVETGKISFFLEHPLNLQQTHQHFGGNILAF